MHRGLYDAHTHLAAEELEVHLDAIDTALAAADIQTAVVNGTSPNDWDRVLNLKLKHTTILPAIGLHPWQVNEAPSDWQNQFEAAFQQGARIVGEIGLDLWVDGHDIDMQREAFVWQLDFATKHNLPVSIHCLRAFGPLMPILRTRTLPKRGIHLHAYNGSTELMLEIVALGGYFSFNSGQLKPNAKTVYETIQAVPSDRLLIETDAPDMLPPREMNPATIAGNGMSKPLNHPKNLLLAYEQIARLRDLSLSECAEQVAENFRRYFID